MPGSRRERRWRRIVREAAVDLAPLRHRDCYSVGPSLGNVEAGAVASAFSVRTSIVSGGVLCVLGSVILGVALPAFRRYDARNAAPSDASAATRSDGGG